MPDTLQGLSPSCYPLLFFWKDQGGGGGDRGLGGGRFIPLWSSDPQCSDYHKTQSRLGFAARRKISLSLWNFIFRTCERRGASKLFILVIQYRQPFSLTFVSRNRTVSCFVKTVSCYVKTVKQRRYPWSYGHWAAAPWITWSYTVKKIFI